MWLVESALIGAVFLVFVVLVCVWQDRAPAERLADPEPMPGEWPLPFASEYGPWPTADTGALPRISPSSSAAASPVHSPTCARKSPVGTTAAAVKRMCW